MRDLSKNLMVIPFLGPTTVTASKGNLTSAFDTWYNRSQVNNMLIVLTIASSWAASGVVILQPMHCDTNTSASFTTMTDYTATCNQTTGLFHFVMEVKNFKRYVKIRYDAITQTAIMALLGILDHSRREPVGVQTTVSEVTATTSSSSSSCSSSSSSSSSA